MARQPVVSDPVDPASMVVADYCGLIWGKTLDALREHMIELFDTPPANAGINAGKVWVPVGSPRIDTTRPCIKYRLNVNLVPGPLSKHERVRYLREMEEWSDE